MPRSSGDSGTGLARRFRTLAGRGRNWFRNFRVFAPALKRRSGFPAWVRSRMHGRLAQFQR
eukprot:14142037-Alexandrium_andersonii.AAC.1